MDSDKLTPWFKKNRNLFEEERAAIAKACPLMGLSIVGPEFRVNEFVLLKNLIGQEIEAAVVHGTYSVEVPTSEKNIEYGIVLVTPSNYPNRPPDMFVNDAKLPIPTKGSYKERHIMNGGLACLAVDAEISLRWRPNPNLVNFLESFVAPFLVWQAYYDTHGKPPPWGDRPHEEDGILDFYKEFWGEIDSEALNIKHLMTLLSQKNAPKGHEICPCGSGKRLRDCHWGLVKDRWQKLYHHDVMKDIEKLREAARKSKD